MTSGSVPKTDSEKPNDNVVKKIVIRRLPPTLTKEQFLDIVSPLPEYDYFYYCNADLSLGAYAFCRAYICFKNHQDVFNFRDRFDNYVFVDSKSNEYPAIVEYAPYQRRYKFDPKNPPKKDSKCNTIEDDTDYQKFLENFGKPTGDQLPSCEAILEELEQKEKENVGPYSAPKVMTPLLEYLKKKKEDKRSGKDRDRDRDRGNRRRDRERDRDDEKRYGGGGGGGYGSKRRDDYYYGSSYKSKDYESTSKNQSNSSTSQKTSSSSQPKITLAPKSEFKSEVLNKGSGQQQSQASGSNKTEIEKSNTPSKNSQQIKDNKDNRPSSSTSSQNSFQNKGGYGNRNSGGNYGSSSRNSAQKNYDDRSFKEKNPPSNKSQSTNDSKSKEDKQKDQGERDGQKPVRNKDRPSIQIYNPAQRTGSRQSKN
ncbi:unnamed protein product [Brachionus calyciflorus]|uniref:UPF3 domain-containing protein n=1 Tax=Brachionus calyciflorus TaxID=104777 RepID=A0A813LZ75_9BILA|nr:unnamed protein product [Brachionus calyciflorus]